jgi:hypothetical protein
MTNVNEPRVVTPEEAQAELANMGPVWDGTWHKEYAYTVATEHKRRDEYARAAVVKALRKAADVADNGWIDQWADDIENGVGW